jgi:RNA polymerase sigma factor (sigma-70 family)
MMTETQAAALSAFLRANKGKLHANAYQITGNRPDADELVQITACKLAEHWADMRPEPLNWALTAMQNAWKDERKSARRRLTVSMDARGEDDELALGERLADPAPGPEAHARTLYIAERVREALGGLSARHRQVLAKRGLEALPYAEMARLLDALSGTVKSRIHRAAASARRVMVEDPR